MRLARSLSAWLLVLVLAPRALAQVSCADPDNLCTGDPCTTTRLAVQSPCVVDFGARALVIGGVLEVPSGGTLSFTAARIRVQGAIEGPGASVTLVATAGDAELRTEMDVASGSIDVSATGDIEARKRLKAKPGGSVTLAAGGTLATAPAAVIEAGTTGSGGTVALGGAAGVTIEGPVRAETIQVDSSAGLVTLKKDLDVSGEFFAGSVAVNGEAGVIVNKSILANSKAGFGGSVTLTSGAGNVTLNAGLALKSKFGPGGIVTLTSEAGNVALNSGISVGGPSGGLIFVDAPLGSVDLQKALKASGKIDGGSVAITAASITPLDKIEAKGNEGDGGMIHLAASTTLTVASVSLTAPGRVNGGVIRLLGGVASGDVTVESGSITATGGEGNGGVLVVSAPAGTVDLRTKAKLTAKSGRGGEAQVSGVAITVGPKTRIDADGRLGGGELRFKQSGTGLFLLDGIFEARDNGVIEALAPSGSLTARGEFSAGPSGCVGFSAGGTLNTSGAIIEPLPLAPNCP